MSARKPVLKPVLITPGEPAGIGPDLVVKIAQTALPFDWVVAADPDLLEQRAKQCGLKIRLEEWTGNSAASGPGVIKICPISLKAPCEPGVLDPVNSAYVLETLVFGAQSCLSGQFAAMVTGPVHKGVINDAGIPFTGQTEFLAKETNAAFVVMMLAVEQLRVALVTTHLPLKDVAAAITEARLTNTVTTLYRALQQFFGLVNPNIYVCGLNPHAGEDGHLGREEIDIINPVLEALRQTHHWQLIGPLPADSLFTEKYLSDADAVLAMYHDQGLPVLKNRGFGHAVNISLGLPIIRTSVDHGTALDLAGTGAASQGSLLAAVEMALSMVTQRITHEI